MTRRRRHRWVITAAVILAVVATVAVVVLAAAGGSGPAGSASAPAGSASTSPTGAATSAPTAPSSTTALPSARPAAADIAAARACQAFTVYLRDAERGRIPAADGRRLAAAAAALVRGPGGRRASTASDSRWSILAADLLDAAEDVIHHRAGALATAGAAAGAQCRLVPTAAARAGGFVRRG